MSIMGDYRRSSKEKLDGSPNVKLARRYVLNLFEQRQDARLVLHNYAFTTGLVELVREITEGEALNPEETEVALLTAWFLPTGYLTAYEEYWKHSLAEAKHFFQHSDFPTYRQRRVLDSIQRIGAGEAPQTQVERILQDACQINTYLIYADERKALLRLEEEFFLNRSPGQAEWSQRYLQRLAGVQWHTNYARNRYAARLDRRIQDERQKLEHFQNHSSNGMPNDAEAEEERFDRLEKKLPTRATQTFFRTNYRNHINLSSIADNKANIMISVNSILISVLITFMSYKNISQTNPHILLPVIIFLVTGLTSLTFAVLSARPKVTSLNRQPIAPEQARRNIVFFGNFVQLELEEYEEAMDAMFRDSKLLYGNMTRDLYYLGKVLDKKYRFLTISYNTFMLGFAATVLSFIYILFT